MWQDRSFCKPMSRETGFSTRPERQKTPTTSENAAKGKHGCITNDTEEIQEKINYEDSAEFLPYAEYSDLLEQEEEQEAANC